MTMDARGWVAFGLFLMAFFELTLRALIPELRSDEIFKEVTQGTFTSGIFLLAAFYFGSSKKDPPA